MEMHLFCGCFAFSFITLQRKQGCFFEYISSVLSQLGISHDQKSMHALTSHAAKHKQLKICKIASGQFYIVMLKKKNEYFTTQEFIFNLECSETKNAVTKDMK
ncbi:hypothetical protein T01_378 [Trichinella spiralis]|uniref:Uncharacterized protein n=1 Tax=Trichinella spiralis TaxID=6334 RepID=A0A0V1C319_TRISP|nr:hypothetical protein T01_378 [Trichinella spiralis]